MNFGCMTLYILVEGPDDVRFFNKVIMPIYNSNIYNVLIRPIGNECKDIINGIIRKTQKGNSNYIYIVDINNLPCIRKAKDTVENKIKYIDKSKISIVIKEIESWYLAGIDTKAKKELGINKCPSCTDKITKENFNDLIPKKFYSSRTDFMIEILKHFSIDEAKERNVSFRYFYEKFI